MVTTRKGRAQHTAGPWRVVRSCEYTDDPTDTKILSIQGADGTTVYYTDAGYFKPHEADVALIAAAPDMAAFIRTITGWWESGSGPIPLNPAAHIFEDDRTVLDHARALLARLDTSNSPALNSSKDSNTK